MEGVSSKRTGMKVHLLSNQNNTLVASVNVGTFQPGNFAGLGSEGVNFKFGTLLVFFQENVCGEHGSERVKTNTV